MSSAADAFAHRERQKTCYERRSRNIHFMMVISSMLTEKFRRWGRRQRLTLLCAYFRSPRLPRDEHILTILSISPTQISLDLVDWTSRNVQFLIIERAMRQSWPPIIPWIDSTGTNSHPTNLNVYKNTFHVSHRSIDLHTVRSFSDQMRPRR